MKNLIKYIALKRKEKELQGKMESLKPKALEEAQNAGSKGTYGDASFLVKVTKGKWQVPEDDAIKTIDHLIEAKREECERLCKSLYNEIAELTAQKETIEQELIASGKATKSDDKPTLEIKFK